jgi:hypothetical protein
VALAPSVVFSAFPEQFCTKASPLSFSPPAEQSAALHRCNIQRKLLLFLMRYETFIYAPLLLAFPLDVSVQITLAQSICENGV